MSEVISPNRLNVQYDNTDEIDLIELVAILWKGKWIVLGITLVVAFTAVIVLKSLPSYYAVEAVVDATSPYEIQALQPSILRDGEEYQVASVSEDRIYNLAIGQANSSFVLRAFWENITGEKLPLFVDGESDDENLRSFKEFVERLTVTVPGKNDTGALRTRFVLEGENPAQTVELVQNLLGFLDSYVIEQYIKQLENAYRSNLDRLQYDYDNLKKIELQRIDDDLLQLSEALAVAKSLNIEDTPYRQVENVELKVLDDRIYLLGSRVLSEEIRSLEVRKQKPIEAFVPRLRDMEQWIRQIEKDLDRLSKVNGKVHAFVISSPPESSLNPVSPKKFLILIAAAFVAGLVGVVVVFVRHGMSMYKSRAAAHGL